MGNANHRTTAVVVLTGALTFAASRVCADGQSVDTNAAYQLLNTRVSANREAFYVYQDQDAGANHGFLSGFFGQIDKLHIDAGCLDDPLAVTGCSTDPNRLDMVRGTVLRISFDPPTLDQFIGLNIEEPEDWGVTR